MMGEKTNIKNYYTLLIHITEIRTLSLIVRSRYMRVYKLPGRVLGAYKQ